MLLQNSSILGLAPDAVDRVMHQLSSDALQFAPNILRKKPEQVLKEFSDAVNAAGGDLEELAKALARTSSDGNWGFKPYTLQLACHVSDHSIPTDDASPATAFESLSASAIARLSCFLLLL
jgi:hypothetical protein